jgi:hypothetical protein
MSSGLELDHSFGDHDSICHSLSIVDDFYHETPLRRRGSYIGRMRSQQLLTPHFDQSRSSPEPLNGGW